MKQIRQRMVMEDGEVFLPREVVVLLLNVSGPTLSTWLSSSDPPPFDRIKNAFPARELGDWIRQKQTVRRGQGGSYPFLPEGVSLGTDNGEKNYQSQRTRKERLAADKIEFELDKARGEVVLASDVEKAWTDILSRIKVRMMRVPYSVASLCVGENDQLKMQSTVVDIVKDALMELSGGWQPDEEDDERPTFPKAV